MIVLDTNVVSEAMKAQPTPAVRAWLDAQVAETLYLSSITLAKMLFCINNPLSAPSLIYIKSDNFPDTGGDLVLGVQFIIPNVETAILRSRATEN